MVNFNDDSLPPSAQHKSNIRVTLCTSKNAERLKKSARHGSRERDAQSNSWETGCLKPKHRQSSAGCRGGHTSLLTRGKLKWNWSFKIFFSLVKGLYIFLSRNKGVIFFGSNKNVKNQIKMWTVCFLWKWSNTFVEIRGRAGWHLQKKGWKKFACFRVQAENVETLLLVNKGGGIGMIF